MKLHLRVRDSLVDSRGSRMWAITQWIINQQVWAEPCFYSLVAIACIKYIVFDWK